MGWPWRSGSDLWMASSSARRSLGSKGATAYPSRLARRTRLRA